MTGYAGPDGSETVVRPGPAGNRIALHHRPGRPGAVPLVLCSGIGAPQQVLTPFVDHLDPARPVIGVDPPGIGEAPPVRRPYRLPLLAGAVRAAVHHLGYRRFDVLGVSWGGGLAQQLAFSSPRRCRRQVLVATGTGGLMVPAGPCTLARMLTPRRHQDPRYAAEIVGELYGGSARTDPAGVLSALHPGPSATSRGGYLAQLGALADAQRRPDTAAAPSDGAHALMERLADRSMVAYRDLIDDELFWPWYAAATPIAHIAGLSIASRPISRKGVGELDFNGLRAIPWVFSWTQPRYTAPGWYGVGTALADAITGDDLALLRELQDEWPFFQAITGNALREMARKPSEQLREQFGFTPFPFEDVGALVRQTHPDLYLFSSDYPHAEGGRDPLGRFDRSLAGFDPAVLRKFEPENFERVFGAQA